MLNCQTAIKAAFNTTISTNDVGIVNKTLYLLFNEACAHLGTPSFSRSYATPFQNFCALSPQAIIDEFNFIPFYLHRQCLYDFIDVMAKAHVNPVLA